MREWDWERIGAWVAWVAAGLFALFLVTWKLGFAAWATDEPVYRNAAVAIFDYGNWSHNLEHPPLGKLLMGVAIQLGGGDATAWAVRAPSALASLVCGALLALLARRITGSAVAAFATFAAWTFLPHPDPSFDLARLGYLDMPMAMFCAGALYAAWRWQEDGDRRWAVACGVLVGLALATKFTALFVLAGIPLLVVRRADVPTRDALRELGIIGGIAGLIALVPWLPLRLDLPHALRFAASMQARDVDQVIEVAGTRYTDGAPFWAQLWWQWDAWPTVALAQLAGVVLAWWVLPRRALLLVWASVFVPMLVFALGSRTLPHWQVAWQIGTSLLVGTAIAWLLAHARASAGDTARIAAVSALGGLAMSLIVIFAAQQRFADVRTMPEAPVQDLSRELRAADVPGGIVLDVARIGVDRALVRAHPAGWNGTYHSAAESQHDWVRRDGGRPLEPEPDRFRRTTWSPDELTGVVAQSDTNLPVSTQGLDDADFRRIYLEQPPLFVWWRARGGDDG